MSLTIEQVADHVLDRLIDASGWAEKNGSPREVVLACALETAVNLLAFERGSGALISVLEGLSDLLREGESVEHGWVLQHLHQFSRPPAG